MSQSRRIGIGAVGLLLVLSHGAARAKDIGKLDGSPYRLDVTETALLNWHGDNLNATRRLDDNYAEWINRFNVLWAWKAWQVGLRIDSVKYAGAPRLAEFRDPANGYSADDRALAEQQLPHRYRDTLLVQGNLRPSTRDPSIWPSKVWVSYIKPKFELTLGDAYVAFGRGFVLNIRKFDEIGADTTLQGAKVVGRVGKVTLTGVVGLSNPTRVDDATGTKLADAPIRCEESTAATCRDGWGLPWQTWSRDFIAGARAETKIGTTTVGVHAADIHRRARVDDPTAGKQLFTNDPTFVRDVLGVGANLSAPRISEAFPLNLYSEIAVQRRVPFEDSPDKVSNGYAAYAAASYTAGIVTTSFEGKHYRHYNPVRLNADRSKYGAFSAVQYTANPTVELITQDSLFDNSCTTGGRGRVDVKVTKAYTLFASAGQFANWGLGCGADPTLGITAKGGLLDRHDITDLYTGFDLRAEHGSYLTVMFGTRRETKDVNGDTYYREGWLQANGSQVITGPYSVEVDMWHRDRFQNGEAWREGQTYLSLKYASRGAVVFGHEYSTRGSQINPNPENRGHDLLRPLRIFPFDTNGDGKSDVQHFLNVGGQIKFGDDVIVRFLFGEQRAALKCVSGVCRFFPAFAGLRSELIIRY
ncbi:MAG: hypothetical protein HYV09_09775 [Deltaproteobacteria bacterium]|nr:hypothetical protein [Deltaproteobacteria bacterium]